MNDYIYGSCIALLEDKLPAELLKEVMTYLTNDTVDDSKRISQIDRVYHHLLEHGEITNMQCHLLYGIRHCPSVIRGIKKKLERENQPYYIDTHEANGANRYGDKTTWYVYCLKSMDENGQCKLWG